jgi:hypothetical protein
MEELWKAYGLKAILHIRKARVPHMPSKWLAESGFFVI